MKRILCIVGSMDMGGAETFLMKIYRVLDRNNYQMDFCVAKEKKGFYEDEIERMGGKIYRIKPKSKGVWKNFNDIKRIVKNNHYQNVMRVSQNSLSALELLAARIGGAKNVVFRSSNSSTCGGRKSELVHYLFRPVANLISKQKIAPSEKAGRFMFGRRRFVVLNNGLPIDDFKFSLDYRKKYRNEFKAGKKSVVIGHVGRFSKQKNHKLLIDIFEKYNEANPDSVLWLLGTGELEDDVRRCVAEKGLTKRVIFFGIRDDINKIYSAMDCFVFPSLYEGMPNTVIEAQASGLPCLVSDTITKDCQITENVKYCSLMSIDDWVNRISIINDEQRGMIKVDEKYDIEKVVNDFIEIAYGG